MLPYEEKLDPRVKRTRKLLVQAFSDLLAQQSMQSITVQDITDRATVNRATFYAHFNDKYALFDYLIGATFRKMLVASLLDTCQFSIENLKRLIVVVAEFLSQLNSQWHPSDEQYRPLMETQIQNQVYDLILHWLEGEEGELLEIPTKPEIAATALSWAIFGTSLNWSRKTKPDSVEGLADQLLLVITGGMIHPIAEVT